MAVPTEVPHVCTPVALPPNKLEEAARHAWMERAANLPGRETLADAVNLLASLTSSSYTELERSATIMLTRKMWPAGRTLTVGWFRGEYTEDDKLRERIRNLINNVEVYANIQARFIGFENVHEADIRIADRPDGSWSYVGPDVLSIPRDQPTLNLGWLEHDMDVEELRRVTIHEWFHTLGLEHEQSHFLNDRRYDKPYIYNYYRRTQGWTEAETDWQFFRLLAQRGTTFDAFDVKSIMLYAIPPQFLIDPSQAVGWNTKPSAGDRAFLSRIYPYPKETV